MTLDTHAAFGARASNLVPAAGLPYQVMPAPQNMDLKSAAYMLRRRARLIAAVAVVTMVIALIVSMLITPSYKADTLLMLEPRRTAVTNMQDVVSPLTASNEALRSEMEIIKSRAVIDRVIDRLKLAADPEFNRPSRGLGAINPLKWGHDNLPQAERDKALRSSIAGQLKNHLSVTNDGKSYIIDIAYQGHDRYKAALIANAFADAYMVDQMEAKYEEINRANDWLNERLGELKSKVEDSEQAVQAFRENSNLIELDGGGTVASKQMQDINEQLAAARGDTAQAEARLRTAQAALRTPGGLANSADVMASPTVQNLRAQEVDMKRTEADLATRYGPLHPKMIDAEAQYRVIEGKIAEEGQKVVQGLANQVEIARAHEAQVQNQLGTLENRAGVELKAGVNLHQLEREADANKSLYENFLNRFKETSEQSDMQTSDTRIVSRAEVPNAPFFPKKSIFMVVGLMLGAILGVIGAYLVEYFDRGFRNAAQLEEMSGMPVIGVVPDVRQLTRRTPEEYVADKPMSSYGEALRTVRTAIHFSNVDQPPKTVMVTSSIPGEGKTTFCLSLARTLARTGNRVLLIDADMRRSRVAAAIGLKKVSGGLADILAGDKPFAEVVAQDPMVADLDLVLTASRTPNAQDLLGSHRMQEMIATVSTAYDLVIIDTPPILAVSDAALVARVSDASIFLVHWARTPRDQALQAIKQLTNLKCHLAGVVLSQVDLAEQAKYSDSYYHRNYTDYYVN